MLESGLFFALGFLCSALLALMVAPAIWRRAVLLTRKRIEASVPLTLNEIQADKDQLRAEFAMSTRRLEVNLENLKERAAEQLIEINRKRDEMAALEEETLSKNERITELEAQSSELRSEMRRNEEKLSVTVTKLASVEIQMEEKAIALEDIDQRYKSAVDEFDGQKIEMVARETRMDTIQDEFQEVKKAKKAESIENAKLKQELKSARAAFTKGENRNIELEDKLSRLKSQFTDMEARLERRDSDLARLRGKSGDAGGELKELEKENDALIAERTKLQEEIATLNLRMDTVLSDAGAASGDDAISAFEEERKDLKDQLRKVEAEKEAMKIELSTLQIASGEDWDTERRENAIMRERINDLAAQVTSMTASLEGPDSPINQALDKAKKPRKSKTTKSKTKSGSETAKSLADRIRALQANEEKA